jgi:hypothetical protein
MRSPRFLAPVVFGLMVASCDGNIAGPQPVLEPLRSAAMVGETIVYTVSGKVLSVTLNPDGIATKTFSGNVARVTCRNPGTVDVVVRFNPPGSKVEDTITCKCPCGCESMIGPSSPSPEISLNHVLFSRRESLFDESSCHEQGSSG